LTSVEILRLISIEMNTHASFSLPLAPIPVSRMENNGEPRAIDLDGFVDDAVIASLLASGGDGRIAPNQSDLILASDAEDFAGWTIQSYSPFRIIAEQHEIGTISQEPDEGITGLELGSSARGGHRGWIVTAFSILSLLILSLLFSSLVLRGEINSPFSEFMERIDQVQSWLGSLAP
jgi:hypothetical protein